LMAKSLSIPQKSSVSILVILISTRMIIHCSYIMISTVSPEKKNWFEFGARFWTGLDLARTFWTGSTVVQGQGQHFGGPDLRVQVQVQQNVSGPGPDRPSASLVRTS
jgi:hypothetical protein